MEGVQDAELIFNSVSRLEDGHDFHWFEETETKTKTYCGYGHAFVFENNQVSLLIFMSTGCITYFTSTYLLYRCKLWFPRNGLTKSYNFIVKNSFRSNYKIQKQIKSCDHQVMSICIFQAVGGNWNSDVLLGNSAAVVGYGSKIF